MKPSRDLDALIAEKVMGWTNEYLPDIYGIYRSVWYSPNRDDCFKKYVGPKWSTDIHAAWRIVEKLDKRFCLIKEDPNSNERPYKAWFQKDAEEGYSVSYGESAAHVICLAALKAIGIEKL